MSGKIGSLPGGTPPPFPDLFLFHSHAGGQRIHPQSTIRFRMTLLTHCTTAQTEQPHTHHQHQPSPPPCTTNVVYPKHIHVAVRHLNELLRKGLRETLQPYELPHSVPCCCNDVEDTKGHLLPSKHTTTPSTQVPRPDPSVPAGLVSGTGNAADDDANGGDTAASGTTKGAIKTTTHVFHYDDLFSTHSKWMQHLSTLQPTLEDTLLPVLREHHPDDDDEEDGTLDCPATSVSDPGSEGEGNTNADATSTSTTTTTTSTAATREFTFSIRKRNTLFDDLQTSSRCAIDQKRKQQKEHDSKLREYQIRTFCKDFSARSELIRDHIDEVRSSWMNVLPTLQMYRTPNTPEAHRTLQWLHHERLVPSDFSSCVDTLSDLASRIAPLCPIVATAALSRQFYDLLPWAAGAVTTDDSVSYSYSDPMWVFGRVACSAGMLHAIAPHLRPLATSILHIRSEVLLGALVGWTCGVSVKSCAGVAAITQSLAYCTQNRVTQLMCDVWKQRGK
jgi:hypothetical protein